MDEISFFYGRGFMTVQCDLPKELVTSYRNIDRGVLPFVKMRGLVGVYILSVISVVNTYTLSIFPSLS